MYVCVQKKITISDVMNLPYAYSMVGLAIWQVFPCPGDMTPLQELFDQWLAAGQDWKKSEVYIKITNNVGSLDTDARDWLTLGELTQKIGAEAAESMQTFLEENKPEKCRDHPDAPGVKAHLQQIAVCYQIENPLIAMSNPV